MWDVSRFPVDVVEIDDMKSLLAIVVKLEPSFESTELITYEASTTSLPHGEMDADPTGCSTLIDASFSYVGLS
jgi:hypothetical protein